MVAPFSASEKRRRGKSKGVKKSQRQKTFPPFPGEEREGKEGPKWFLPQIEGSLWAMLASLGESRKAAFASGEKGDRPTDCVSTAARWLLQPWRRRGKVGPPPSPSPAGRWLRPRGRQLFLSWRFSRPVRSSAAGRPVMSIVEYSKLFFAGPGPPPLRQFFAPLFCFCIEKCVWSVP